MNNTIIFDMDGTLLDTEKYYRKYWRIASEETGYPMTDEMVLSLRSLGRPFSTERINTFFNDERAYNIIRGRRMELIKEAIKREGIQLKPYVKETLGILKEKGFRLAVATATDEERTKEYLEKMELEEYFSDVICATMVKCGKPAPDIYLYACEKMNIKPEETYAVEDSPNGILSAYRAGCKVIMIPDQTLCDDEVRPYLTFLAESMKDLPGFLLEER